MYSRLEMNTHCICTCINVNEKKITCLKIVFDSIFFTFPSRFGILKVTLNLELTLDSLIMYTILIYFLQTVCEDILIDKPSNFYAGLLHNPPSKFKEELMPLLEKCAYPAHSKGTIVRKPTSDDVYWKLHNLLKRIIRES